jgi:hypothetical protein
MSSGGTIGSVQNHVVGVSDLRDGALDSRSALRAQAYLPRQFVRHTRRWRLTHVLQGRLHFAFGKYVQERRLCELRGESLAKRAVEHRVARGVGEIGEDDGAFRVKFRVVVREKVGAAGDQRDHDGRRGDERQAAARHRD